MNEENKIFEEDTINVDNPINILNSIYKFVTVENIVKSFMESVKILFQNLDLNRNIYKDVKIFRSRWDEAEDTLRKINKLLEDDIRTPSILNSLDIELYSIIDMFSNTGFLTKDGAKFQVLNPLFENFSDHISQAREIVTWLMFTTSKIDIKMLPYMCYTLADYVEDQYIKEILWSISILGDYPLAIESLDEESETEIDRAKEFATKKLKDMFKDISSSYSSSLHNILDRYIEN